MRFIRLVMGALILPLFAASAYANVGSAADIMVVTDAQHPVHNVPPDARVVLLDEPEELLQALSGDLPDVQNQAQVIAAERLRQQGMDQRQMQYAVQGLVDAWSLQVQKIPAVIFDKTYVVYGENNVDLAIEQIKHYLTTEAAADNAGKSIVSHEAGGQYD